MASFLTGLGRGIGSAAQGYLKGQNLGEAEAYRRGKSEEDRALKKLALQQKRQELDPDEATRKLAGNVAIKLIESRGHPELAGFFTRYPELARNYDQNIANALGVAKGDFPVSQFNPQFYQQLADNLPGGEERDFVTPKQEAASRGLDIRERGVAVREQESEENKPYRTARGEREKLELKFSPELLRQKVVGGVANIQNTRARTGLTGAQTTQTKALTPIKKQQGEATVKKVQTETAAIPRRVAVSERQATTAERRAKTDEERLALEREYKRDLMRRAKTAAGRQAKNEAEKRLQARITANLRILTATKDILDTSVFSDPRRQKAQAQLDADLKAWDNLGRPSRAEVLKEAQRQKLGKKETEQMLKDLGY